MLAAEGQAPTSSGPMLWGGEVIKLSQTQTDRYFTVKPYPVDRWLLSLSPCSRRPPALVRISGDPKFLILATSTASPGPDASGLAEVRTVYPTYLPTYLLTLSLSIYGWD